MSGIAWWAHIGGFVVGVLLVRFFAVRKPTAMDIYYHQGRPFGGQN
jgi:membrane associated rhomboid family serine protease